MSMFSNQLLSEMKTLFYLQMHTNRQHMRNPDYKCYSQGRNYMLVLLYSTN